MATRVICISREFGSGGHEIGVKTAAKLGVKAYEKELLGMACRYGDVSEETLRDADERATNPMLFRNVYEGNYHVMRGLPTSEVLFALQSHEIRRIAAREDCIFIGRCADKALCGEADVQLISAFVSAPLSDRIARKMEQERLSRERATRLVKRMDRQRRRYYEHYTGHAWGDPRCYDLMIDSAETGVDGAIMLLTERFFALR